LQSTSADYSPTVNKYSPKFSSSLISGIQNKQAMQIPKLKYNTTSEVSVDERDNINKKKSTSLKENKKKTIKYFKFKF